MSSCVYTLTAQRLSGRAHSLLLAAFFMCDVRAFGGGHVVLPLCVYVLIFVKRTEKAEAAAGADRVDREKMAEELRNVEADNAVSMYLRERGVDYRRYKVIDGVTQRYIVLRLVFCPLVLEYSFIRQFN